MPKISLKDRPMSGFPVSMGTGLSLETLFTPIQEVYDPERTVTKVEDIHQFTHCLINVSTLLRNMISSYNFEQLVSIRKQEFLTTTIEEISFIKLHFMSQQFPVSFYIDTYRSVKDSYQSKNRLRTVTTDKAILVDTITQYCLDNLRKNADVITTNSKLPPSSQDHMLVLTHIPYDLISYRHFRSLTLLESNTGMIKPRELWYSKYYPIPDKDMSFLPLLEYPLSIFGDHVMFRPSKLQDRLNLYTQLLKQDVHPLTSEYTMKLKL